MNYPFIIDGAERGSLCVEREGLFTLMELWTEKAVGTGILRVSVYGDGQEAYLGVMEPKGGGMWLRRKLSRNEMRTMPGKIEYAALSGGKGSASPLQAAPSPAPPESLKAGSDETIWYRRPDGTLWTAKGDIRIVAIPSKLRKPADGAVLRVIDGQNYMLFRY